MMEFLIPSVFTVVGVFLSGFFLLARDQRKMELENKKIAYEEVVSMMMTAVSYKNKNELSQEEISKIFSDIMIKIIPYGSTEFLIIYRKFQKQSGSNSNIEDMKKMLCCMEDVLFQIRKEINPKEINNRGDILSLILTDYEEIFG